MAGFLLTRVLLQLFNIIHLFKLGNYSMQNQILRNEQEKFMPLIPHIIKERAVKHALRLKFITEFNLDVVSTLPIDKYVLGKGKQTFCYRIERELEGLGRITNATAPKFGVYFGNGEYKNAKKWDINLMPAYRKIRNSICDLIKAGEIGNREAILNNKISPMFKGKILSVYYPDKYLNVFSDDHLSYFIKCFHLDTPGTLKMDPVIKREILVDFKNKDSIMKDWSIDVFSYFIYRHYPLGPKDEKPNYFDFDYEIGPIPIEIQLAIEQNLGESLNSRKNSKNSKTNWDELHKENNITGARGEKAVMDFERNKLFVAGKVDLSNLVKRVSLDSDKFGIDILSFDIDGTPKHIEVKSTQSKVGDTNFYITENELRKAKELPNYYLYIVYEARSKTPKIWILENPFNPMNKNVHLRPVNYVVGIKVKK